MKLLLLSLLTSSFAWAPATHRPRPATSLEAAVGIFYGTSSGNTMDCAMKIYECLGDELADEPIDVDTMDDAVASLSQYEALIVGTPTWNTGADTERSGTGWDDLYYDVLPKTDALKGKPVAVFGLGDQESYGDSFSDATGELFDVFEGLGCRMFGSWSQEGYEHTASKAIRGDKFCGLILDMINQDDLTDDRVEDWIEQLKVEGFFSATGSAPAVVATPVELPTASSSMPQSEPIDVPIELAQLDAELTEHSETLDMTIESHSSGGFTPHVNHKTGKTMWVSPDGRQSYVTEATQVDTTSLKP